MFTEWDHSTTRQSQIFYGNSKQNSKILVCNFGIFCLMCTVGSCSQWIMPELHFCIESMLSLQHHEGPSADSFVIPWRAPPQNCMWGSNIDHNCCEWFVCSLCISIYTFLSYPGTCCETDMDRQVKDRLTEDVHKYGFGKFFKTLRVQHLAC